MSVSIITEFSLSLPSHIGISSKEADTLQEDVLTKSVVCRFVVAVVTEINALHLPAVVYPDRNYFWSLRHDQLQLQLSFDSDSGLQSVQSSNPFATCFFTCWLRILWLFLVILSLLPLWRTTFWLRVRIFLARMPISQLQKSKKIRNYKYHTESKKEKHFDMTMI